MSRTFLIIALLFGPCLAKADVFYTLVGVKCNPATDRLIVYYVGAYNSAGEAMIAGRTRNEFDPETLVQPLPQGRDSNGRRIWDRFLKTRRTCVLSHGTYEVGLGAFAGGGMGTCQGGGASPSVQIWRGGQIIVPIRGFDAGDCFSQDAPVLVRITIDATSANPRIKEVPQRDFVR